MLGGYVWASVWLDVLVVGLATVYVAGRYARTRLRRAPLNRSRAPSIGRGKYRHPAE